MSSFLKYLRGVSLPIKVTIGAFLTGATVILLALGFLKVSINQAFESQLNELLDEKAFQHRVRFSRSIESYYSAVKLLSTQQPLIDYLKQDRQNPSRAAVTVKGRPPAWLPNYTFFRSFLAPHYAFLYDPDENLRVFYQSWPEAPPAELYDLPVSTRLLATGQTHVDVFDGIPFLLAAEQVRDGSGRLLGSLLLSTPLDETFMISANGPATNWNMVALIDDVSGKVLSSNCGTSIPKGEMLEVLNNKHLFTEPQFLALGGMELTFKLASLVNKDSTKLLSANVIEKEVTAMLVEAIIYMAPFICIIFWLTRRILRLTAKVEEFSMSGLGNEPSPLKRLAGDQLDILEQRFMQLTDDIKKRTTQLETANHELEAFAYSVSHDLRAPLRSIDGFSQALDEDYHEQLDETGLDYLKRVRRAAQRMGTLIDEMLMLSRVSRGEMKLRTVDLSKIVENVTHELAQVHPERQVELRIAQKVKVFGDEGLLWVAITNLLDNAWKFTTKTESAVIEFGVASAASVQKPGGSGSRVFFISDNGVGFDMEFSGKLFGAFQRLHRDTEFPGTGVGLATVQRIINRHEGKIWAESETNNGATFYFSIGEV